MVDDILGDALAGPWVRQPALSKYFPHFNMHNEHTNISKERDKVSWVSSQATPSLTLWHDSSPHSNSISRVCLIFVRKPLFLFWPKGHSVHAEFEILVVEWEWNGRLSPLTPPVPYLTYWLYGEGVWAFLQ